MMDMSKRVRELRDAYDITAQELSDRTGGAVSRITVSDIETGRVGLSLAKAMALAAAFGLSLSNFVDEHEDLSAESIAIAKEIVDARKRLEEALRG